MYTMSDYDISTQYEPADSNKDIRDLDLPNQQINNYTKVEYDNAASYEFAWDWQFSYTQQLTIDMIVLVLSLTALTYGVTSWCVLKKFRSYRNFVFLIYI